MRGCGGPDLPGREVLPRRRDRRSRAAARSGTGRVARRGPRHRQPRHRLGRHRLYRARPSARCGTGTAKLRQRLQSKGTKSAKRLLARRRSRESRFARDVNHVISKKIVREAEDTRRGIKLEDLSGIRGRVTVRKAQRADAHSWALLAAPPVHQLQGRHRRCPAGDGEPAQHVASMPGMRPHQQAEPSSPG